jgi:diguanylate cyclase (GGDEF)-like protein
VDQLPAPPAEHQRQDDNDAQRRRAVGRTAGILFSAGAVASVPANQLFTSPSAPEYVHLITALAFVSGLICFAVAWDRISERWFQLIPIVASLEVALTVWSVRPHTETYSWFYVFVAVFIGYAFRDRRAIAGQLALTCACFALPLAYLDDGYREALIQTVVSIPVIVLTGCIVAFLRERLEQEQDNLRKLADRDALTGVGNYRLLSARLGYELSRHRRHGRRFAVILLDLDGFKEVNETYGHLAGDRVLRDIGAALVEAVRDQDTVARQGGDEFSVLAPEAGPKEAEILAARLCDAVGTVQGVTGPLNASIGWAIFPDDGERPETLLAHADAVARSDKATRRPADGERPEADELPLRLVREAGGEPA